MDRRDSLRTRTPHHVLVSGEGAEGAGALADISYSGALIEETSLRPAVGARVRLYLFPSDRAVSSLEGVVSRHTERGFALRYELHDALLRSAVDAVIEHLTPAAAS